MSKEKLVKKKKYEAPKLMVVDLFPEEVLACCKHGSKCTAPKLS